MRNILKWFQTLKQQAKHDQFVSGFDYAIGAIVRGEKTPLALNAEQYEADRIAFDDGMDAAMVKAIELGIVKDDRMW